MRSIFVAARPGFPARVAFVCWGGNADLRAEPRRVRCLKMYSGSKLASGLERSDSYGNLICIPRSSFSLIVASLFRSTSDTFFTVLLERS